MSLLGGIPHLIGIISTNIAEEETEELTPEEKLSELQKAKAERAAEKAQRERERAEEARERREEKARVQEEEEQKNWLWLYITSGVIGGLLVIILVIYLIKRYAPKKKFKKAKKTLTKDNSSRGQFGE